MSVMLSLLSWFLLVMAAGGSLHTNSVTDEVAIASNSAAVSAYWHTMLPNTVMPSAILELLTPHAGISDHTGRTNTNTVQTTGKRAKNKYISALSRTTRKMGLHSTKEAITHRSKIQKGSLWWGPSTRNDVEKSIFLWALSTIWGPPKADDTEKTTNRWSPPTSDGGDFFKWVPPTTDDGDFFKWGPPTSVDGPPTTDGGDFFKWGPPTADSGDFFKWGPPTSDGGPPTTDGGDFFKWGPPTADGDFFKWGPPTADGADFFKWGPPTADSVDFFKWGPPTADGRDFFKWGPPTSDGGPPTVDGGDFFKWGPPTADGGDFFKWGPPTADSGDFFKWGPPTADGGDFFKWGPPTADSVDFFKWGPPTVAEEHKDDQKGVPLPEIRGEARVGRGNHKHGTMSNMVFLEEALKPGSTITCYILPSATSGAPLLRRDVADTILMSTRNFTDIITMFAPTSNGMAADIWSTLEHCEHPHTIKGETKACVTSVESMVEFAASVLGVSTYKLHAFSSPDVPVEGIMTGRGYKVAAATRVGVAGDTMTCHGARFPFAMFMCHTVNPTRVYSVTLEGQDVGAGGTSQPRMQEVLAVCHLDTSGFDPARMPLHVTPGDAPLCHFLSRDSILWAPAAPASGHAAA